MNERIAELYRQAHLGTKDADGKNPQYFSAEMFAELIVKDAIDSLLDAYGPDDCLPQEEIAGFLKEHFGVE